MNVDNLIRKENQRLVRLSSWAGKKSLLMKEPKNKIEKFFGKEEIRRFLIEKYKKENPPKNAAEIKSLQKRAEKYANKNAHAGYEYRNGVIQIKRDKITQEHAKQIAGQLQNLTPTKSEIKKEVKQAFGKEAKHYTDEEMKKRAIELQKIKGQTDEIAQKYYNLTNSKIKAQIANILRKKHVRKTYAELFLVRDLYMQAGGTFDEKDD